MTNPRATSGPEQGAVEDLDQRVRLAVRSALSALESARARRIHAHIAEALAQVERAAVPNEPWYDYRWRVMDAVLGIALEIAQTRMGHIHLVEAPNASLRLRAQSGFKTRAAELFERVALPTTPCGKAMHTQQHVMIEDVSLVTEQWDEAFQQGLEKSGIAALLCAPIRTSGLTIGTITLYYDSARCVTPDTCLSIELLARELGAILEPTSVRNESHNIASA